MLYSTNVSKMGEECTKLLHLRQGVIANLPYPIDSPAAFAFIFSVDETKIGQAADLFLPQKECCVFEKDKTQ